MMLLNPVLQTYPWGSKTKLPELLGEESPAARPWAEMWFGAHPLAPATLGQQPLSDVIAADPAAQLGPAAALADGKLPFLLKLLAADEPLSLQAHPTLEQAEEGFERENAAGIPLTAPFRNYRDANHKPELIVALTEFDAIAGFRDVQRTQEIFAELGIEELERYTDLLNTSDAAEALRALFTTWLTLPQNVLDSLVAAVAAGCAEYRGDDTDAQLVAKTTVLLANRYPGDPGVLGAMLLNRLRFHPGQAVYLGAGQLHAYLNGMGVEIMANSDNVLRGGLTAKHVDVVELLRVLDFSPLPNPVVEPILDSDGWSVYRTPAREFELCSRELAPGEEVSISAETATIALVTQGAVTVHEDDAIDLACGTATWIAADKSERVRITGNAGTGGTIFLATVPHPHQ